MAQKWALISVSDKSDIQVIATAASKAGYGILSTGGTAKLLREAGLEVKDVADYTAYPEMMDGRVKTLHPKVHGGLLGRRDHKGDLASMQEFGMVDIRLVVVNLYPFRNTVLRDDATLQDAIENIDIGGPSMVRSAAKNHAAVSIVTDPADYAEVAAQLAADSDTTLETRQRLAAKAFAHTAHYDAMVARYFGQAYGVDPLTAREVSFGATHVAELRYGENPHQRAAVYRDPLEQGGVVDAVQLHGKELSYNNYLDLDAAVRMIVDFAQPAAVVLKHTNPCGAATGANLADAYLRAREVDPTSAFGSIIGLNRPVDAATAAAINETFVEAVVAPAFDDEALQLLQQKKNIRLLTHPLDRERIFSGYDVKRIAGGYLVQDFDGAVDPESAWTVPTERQPTESEWQALRFGWALVRHVKSNAVLFCGADRAFGIGAGQMSRVDSSRIAVLKAGEGLLDGSAVASDAFFPFRDGVDAAAEAGAKAIIQPGGSIRDEEVIAAANEHGMAMVFTGRRHFRHG